MEIGYSYGKTILRATDGKKNYEQIAKELEFSKTYISTVLNAAKKRGLAERIKPGIFKKRSGVMSHIPEGKTKKKTVASITKIIKRAKKKSKATEVKDKPFSDRPLKNIEKMTIAYQNLYIVENTLKELIRKILQFIISKEQYTEILHVTYRRWYYVEIIITQVQGIQSF